MSWEVSHCVWKTAEPGYSEWANGFLVARSKTKNHVRLCYRSVSWDSSALQEAGSPNTTEQRLFEFPPPSSSLSSVQPLQPDRTQKPNLSWSPSHSVAALPSFTPYHILHFPEELKCRDLDRRRDGNFNGHLIIMIRPKIE